MLAGVYAQRPDVFGDYVNPLPELTSLFDNDTYFLDIENMGAPAVTHTTPGTADMTLDAMPDVWHATIREIRGFIDAL